MAIEDKRLVFPLVTRVEVIDSSGFAGGRGSKAAWNPVLDRRHQQDIDVSISLEDDGCTLKLFVRRRES